MPIVLGNDTFDHNDFTIPGGTSYTEVQGTPQRDKTIVNAGDPASCLISNSSAQEYLSHALTGTLGWLAFWVYIKAADESATDLTIAQIGATDGAGVRLSFQVSTDKFFINIIGGANFPISGVYPFDTWWFAELILDTSGATRNGYCRMNGADLVTLPATRSIAASTCSTALIGAIQGTPPTSYAVRYSNKMWGTPASVSDWYGIPTLEAGAIDDSAYPNYEHQTFGPF